MPDLPVVSFSSVETLIDVLEGVEVRTRSADGVEASGILCPFRPELFASGVYMVALYDVVTDELLVATDIRNFTEIEVP